MSTKRESSYEHPEAHKKADHGEAHGSHADHHVDHGARAHDHHAEHAATTKPVLYHILHYCSTRPLVIINELGIADKIGVKHVQHSELKSEAYLALNPHGTVPTFVQADGSVILESGAVAMHLLEKYGGQDHALFGKPEHRAELLQWLWYSPATLYPAMGPGFYGSEEEKQKTQKKLDEVLLPYLQSKLGDNQYLVGNEYSLADIFVAYELAGLQHLGWLKKFPKLEAYTSHIMARPAWTSAFTPVAADGAQHGSNGSSEAAH